MKHKSKRNKAAARGRRRGNTGDDHVNPANPAAKDNVNRGDLEGMKQWIESLTFESLVNSLEFSFHANRSEHNGTPAGSHEFDLLLEMASLQGETDNGQVSPDLDEIEACWSWRKAMKGRLETPRLFRWEDSTTDTIQDADDKPRAKGQGEPTPDQFGEDPLAALAMGSAGMPSELLDVLAQAGVKCSTSALLEAYNEVDEVDQAFESLEDCTKNMSKEIRAKKTLPPGQFHIKADRWIAEDGTPLGRGTTIEQQNADRSILLWTTLLRDRRLSTVSPGESMLPRCRLSIGSESVATNHQQCKRLVLDTLHVASRGKFLSKAGRQMQAYLAPWFDPTQQWFSLPLYLASRFEASLWNAYGKREKLAQMSDEAAQDSLVHSVKSLEEDSFGRVLRFALGSAIRDDLYRGVTLSQASSNDSIRDTLIWTLLLCDDKLTTLLRSNFAATPLMEWGSAMDQLKSILMNHLQAGLAHEAERSLMQSTPANLTKHSKGKKKKRQKKKRGPKHLSTPTTSVNAQHEDDQNSDDDDDEALVERILPRTPSGTLAGILEDTELDPSPQSDENCTKMTVLKVLDDILSNVFARVGMPAADDFQDFTDAVIVKSRREPSLDKTRSADDIEVATTAEWIEHDRSRPKVPSKSQRLGSRSRRQSLGDSDSQKDTSNLKRSKSSGDRSMAQKKHIKQAVDAHIAHGDDDLADSPLFPQASQNGVSIFDGAPLCLSGALEGWNSVASQQQSESNIFEDLLGKEEDLVYEDHNFASTAASLASSRGSAEAAGLDIDGLECDAIDDEDTFKAVQFKTVNVHNAKNGKPMSAEEAQADTVPKDRVDSPPPDIATDPAPGEELSPPPSAPPTPPPRVSPILVSLADLGKLREASAAEVDESAAKPSTPLQFTSMRPNLPTAASMPRTLTPSLSRDDLRSIDECRRPPRRDRDDHQSLGHRQVDALLSYRNVVAKQSVPSRKPPSLKSYDGIQKHRDDAHPILARSSRSIKTTRSGMWAPGPEFPSLTSSVSSMPSYKEPILNKILHLDLECARSEGGLDAVDDASHCNVIPRAQTDDTMTKDGATTISTAAHTPPEPEQISTLKEERNSYRDMCLTLGAENAKLRNLLASKMCNPLHNPPSFAPPDTMSPHFYHNDQQFVPASFMFPNQFSSRSMVAMSDAGDNRGDYESFAMSEEGTDMHPTVVAFQGDGHNTWQARGDSVQSYGRRTSGGGTYAESDTSQEYQTGGQDSQAFSGFHRVHHQDSFYGPIPLHGIESRLSKDITRYMQALKSQLKKNEPRRLWAIKQLESTVKALWPRAQIKMYGSHVTKLCLPSSDVDFVISLPAVHKNAPAMAPGDLEGRNAIVETNQKVLARRLKSESWLDQRTIKVIERTAVPVIKVSTKDSRSRAVQLDLSFDAKEHHGLEALNMIQHTLEQLPMVRPLVLVLKQFLLDRGLLTAYTGGLSSYCLFLMVARYCQEQAPTWNDCGSLLMGLLDFYGNFFDPRTTGISVRTRQYFFRSQDVQAQGWDPQQPQFSELTKRNSFSTKPHRFQPLHRQYSFQNAQSKTSQQLKSAKFDPIWVEDPLNPGNNVGRNAFRIFQVQRAFSDAHRALVASLEWDINSMHEFGDDGEYPLLKCLLQNEDVFIAIDDPIHRGAL